MYYRVFTFVQPVWLAAVADLKTTSDKSASVAAHVLNQSGGCPTG
jgi:hypothetical protein